MTDEDRAARRSIHWDGTITAGNVLTAAAMLLALVVWGVRIESNVDQVRTRQAEFEALVRERRAEDLANNAEALRDVRASLARIEGYLRPPLRDR